jgi:hypothetical protein
MVVFLLALPTLALAGQEGQKGVDIEKVLNPVGLSVEKEKAEQLKEQHRAKVSIEFFEAIRDFWIGLLHPAKFGKEIATLEAKPVSAPPAKKGVDVEKVLNPVKLSLQEEKAERFKQENRARVSTEFFEAIRDLWIGLLHPAKFGADVARMPKTEK